MQSNGFLSILLKALEISGRLVMDTFSSVSAVVMFFKSKSPEGYKLTSITGTSINFWITEIAFEEGEYVEI